MESPKTLERKVVAEGGAEKFGRVPPEFPVAPCLARAALQKSSPFGIAKGIQRNQRSASTTQVVGVFRQQ